MKMVQDTTPVLPVLWYDVIWYGYNCGSKGTSAEQVTTE